MPDIKGNTVVRIQPQGFEIMVSFVWQCDGNGDVLHHMDVPLEGIPRQLVTRPVDKKPSTTYNVELLDATGRDVLLGKGASRSITDAETAFLYESTNTDTYGTLAGLHRLKIDSAGVIRAGVVELTIGSTPPIRPEIDSPNYLGPPGRVT